MPDPSQRTPDAVVVGSGFGGAMVAHALVRAGARVLMLERGGWVERGESSWDPVAGFFQQTRHYLGAEGICACVGGASVFYGGASFRFREADFDPGDEIVGDSGARWPLGYAELEPYYTEAEWVLGVAGEAGADPTEPPRGRGYPQAPAPLAPVSERIAEAAERLGLHPFRVPLALNHGAEGRPACVACITCDGYACRIGAKNDLATVVIPALEATGRLELRTGTVVTRLVERGGRIVGVEGIGPDGEPVRCAAPRVILAAGALASPHLLLASGLDRVQGRDHVIGRYLMRHCNAFVYGWFHEAPNPREMHHKQLAIQDFYFGGAEGAPPGKLGNIQQVMHPQIGGVLGVIPPLLRGVRAAGAGVERFVVERLRALFRHVTGLQVIAEDQPRHRNRVWADARDRDGSGVPRLRIDHAYSRRDLQARAALVREAGRILREAGAARALYPHRVNTFSHAVGTVRTGTDPRTSALDEHCRFRGIENLYVVDGSFLPTSGGVNPSLTIAANALRVGAHLVSA